ncbi:MAG: DUF6056 family protein [Erysipelotrichaceae bacterium]|nr:DUF6056 family protein [Erysipelotrichaceae bacterium]MDY5252432.1 DUF6056 family protein [Erysipelotrichaceae bacterium]
MLNKQNKKFISYLIIALLGLLFLVISYWSPLAGDDWWYAVVARYNTPIQAAIKQYFAWSGRFLSELWGYAITPHKWLWNIINPLLFMGIFALIIKVANIKRNQITATLLGLFLILSVNDYVRMQTYSWIMGTTYVIPLLLFLFYIIIAKKITFENKHSWWIILIAALLNIATPLFMENVAAALVGANILLIIYSFYDNKRNIKYFSLFLLLSIIGVLIIRLSPGAVYRLESSHAMWVELNFFEKIASNWANFIRFTFLDNKYLVCVLSLCLMGFTITNIHRYTRARWHVYVLLFIFLLAFGQSISANINSHLNWFLLYNFYDLNYPYTLLITSVIYMVLIGAIIYLICNFYRDEEKWEVLFIFLVGGSANIAMMLSPIFDSRSSIYTIYFMFVITLKIFDDINFTYDKLKYVIAIILTVGSLLFAKQYIYKYKLVRDTNNERMEQIKYYQDHWEDTNAYLVKMPKMTIHSGDVEDGDVFHHEAFYKYFDLNPEIELHFYYKEN